MSACLVLFSECRSSRFHWFRPRWEHLCLELEREEETRLEQMHLRCKIRLSLHLSLPSGLLQIRRIAFAEDGSYFVTVGNRHVKFWYLISTASVEVMPLRGRYAILAERKDNFFMDVVCGRGDCAGMTYVITSTGLICQFDEQRQMQAEQDLQVRSRRNDHRTSLSRLVHSRRKPVV